MGKEKDLTGQRFGRLVALNKIGKYTAPNGSKVNIWHCICDCGNYKDATTSALLSKKTQSCGCLQTESRYTHHLTHDKLYVVYRGMKDRCYNKNAKAYPNYGGRGIGICDNWMEDFLNFYNWSIDNGYAEGLTIDRIDVNGDYCPENCRWITHKAQQFNKRTNVRFAYNGMYLTLPEWSEIVGINVDTLASRIYTRHWSIEKALSEPLHKESRNKNAKQIVK